MKKLYVAIGLFLAIILVGVLYWISGQSPANAKDKSTKIFVIQKGESVREIGNNLKHEGLIRDPVVFFIYIKLNKQDTNIQAGDFRLSPSMNLAAVVNNLNHGILDIWTTFPEGVRADEAADILKKHIPSYEETWRTVLNQNEGYLFPDTYLIPKDATVDSVVLMMRNNFNTKISDLGLTPDAPNLKKAIIIASLIEREAITDEEKPLIAGVIDNRLDLGIALQIDATIQYVKGNSKKWWPQVFREDYETINSPYNTYLNPGLPPGPIANPGIEAIKAAQNPQEHNYLYYIHDKNGKIHPARTIEEHNANVAKYL